MTKFFDALFCYYYVTSKEKVWFAHDSFKLYALAFSAGASAVIIYINALLLLNELGVEITRQGIPKLGLSSIQLLVIFYACFFLFMLFLGIYLKKNKRATKLVKDLKSKDYKLSNASVWVGRVYKASFVFPFLYVLIPLWFDAIITTMD